MKKKNRKLGNFQKRIVLNSLEHSSLPLFCKLIFAEVSRWRSFSSPSETQLGASVTECISLLFQKLEAKHGWFMVAHSLAYITAAKTGITQSELEDLISLGESLLCIRMGSYQLISYIKMIESWTTSISIIFLPQDEFRRSV